MTKKLQCIAGTSATSNNPTTLAQFNSIILVQLDQLFFAKFTKGTGCVDPGK